MVKKLRWAATMPEALRAQGATATHIRGIRDDAFDEPYVVGRRSMPAQGS